MLALRGPFEITLQVYKMKAADNCVFQP